MTFYVTPIFPQGMDILCNVKSLLHQMNTFGATESSFHHLIFDHQYEFFDMIRLQNREILEIVPTNDVERASYNRFFDIWSRFYVQIHSIIPFQEKLWHSKNELEKWAESYASQSKLPSSIRDAFRSAALVVSADTSSKTSANFADETQVRQIEKEFNTLIDSIVFASSDSTFGKKTRQVIANIMAYEDGYRLIKEINAQMQSIRSEQESKETRPLIIKSSDKKNETSSYKNPLSFIINFANKPDLCVCEVGREQKKSVYFSPEVILFHELCHVLQSAKLNNKNSNSHVPTLPIEEHLYENRLEAEAILGFNMPNGICENSFRKQLRLFPRYGHIAGCDPQRNMETNFRHALRYNLSLDFFWILPEINASRQMDLLHEEEDKTKQKISEKHSPEFYENLKKEIDPVMEKSITDAMNAPVGNELLHLLHIKLIQEYAKSQLQQIIRKSNLSAPLALNIIGIQFFKLHFTEEVTLAKAKKTDPNNMDQEAKSKTLDPVPQNLTPLPPLLPQINNATSGPLVWDLPPLPMPPPLPQINNTTSGPLAWNLPPLPMPPPPLQVNNTISGPLVWDLPPLPMPPQILPQFASPLLSHSTSHGTKRKSYE